MAALPEQRLSWCCSDVEGMSDGWDNATAYGDYCLRAPCRCVQACLLCLLAQNSSASSCKGVLLTTPAAQHPVKHAAHQAVLVKGLIRCKGGKTLYVPDAGYNDVKDDESMGWARYAHSMRVFVINSGLFYIRPTQASIELLDRITQRLNTENGWDQAIFNEVCIANPLL